MQDQIASKTALATAYIRAAHQLLDDKPLLLNDPVALPLLGAKAAEIINSSLDRYKSSAGRGLRTHVVLRSRFTEDCLRAAVSKGASQYVLIGAGFDTFTLRRPCWARGLKIIEVDHPATQAAKREYILKAGLSEPDNVTFVPIDFVREELGEVLSRQGISFGEPTFFSWLGVCMYLEESAIDATLRVIASFAAGSQLSMTFKQPLEGSASKLSDRVSDVGEPFISFFTPGEIEAKLRQTGFSRIDFLTPEKTQEAYFMPARNDLPLPKRTDTLCAII